MSSLVASDPPVPDPTPADWKAIASGLRVRPGEAELRHLDAAHPPGGVRPVRVLRTLGRLREIDRERAAALAALRTRTTVLEPALIDELFAVGLPALLLELQNQTWCPGETEREAVRVLVAALPAGTDEQVRRLVADGVLHVLQKAPDAGAVPAVARVLAVGAATGAGRNPYADLLGGLGWVDRLARIRQRNEPPAPPPPPPRGWFGWLRKPDPPSAVAPGGVAAEVDRLIATYFRTPAPEDAFASDGSDRALGWRYLYPFLAHRRFTRWNREEAAAVVVEETCPLVIKLFVSHRWATPADPDPEGQHLPAVVRFLARVFMAANGCLSDKAYVVQNLGLGDRIRDELRERRLDECRCGTAGWLELRGLLDDDDLFYTRVGIDRRRNFYRLLKHVRVWYDYSALPQSRGTPEDEAFLNRALSRLADIVGGAEVLALWGIESLGRAWCVFEALAAGTVNYFAPAHHARPTPMQEFMQRAMAGDPGRAEEMIAYSAEAGPSRSIMITVNQIRSALTGLGEREVREYLVARSIQCTKPSDLDRLAALIHRHLTTTAPNNLPGRGGDSGPNGG